jgi:hypothetical protein
VKEMGEEYATCGRYEKFWSAKLKRIHHFEDLGVNSRKI